MCDITDSKIVPARVGDRSTQLLAGSSPFCRLERLGGLNPMGSAVGFGASSLDPKRVTSASLPGSGIPLDFLEHGFRPVRQLRLVTL